MAKETTAEKMAHLKIDLPPTNLYEVAYLEPGNRVFYETTEGPIGHGITAYFGQWVSQAELVKRYGVENQGFDGLYEWHPDTKRQDAERHEVQIVVSMLRTLAKQSGIPLDSVGLLGLSTTKPVIDTAYFAEMIAEETGLPRGALILEANAGCEGSAIILDRMLRSPLEYPELSGKPAIWAAVEAGRMELLGQEDPLAVADKFSLGILGNVATANMIRLDQSLSYVDSIVDHMDDKRGGIRATTNYPIDQNGPVFQVMDDGRKVRVRIRSDMSGKTIAMDPSIITREVGPFVGNKILRPLLGRNETTLAILHQPSILFQYFVALNAGMIGKKSSPFVVKTGNLSSGSLIVANNLLQYTLKEGDVPIYAGYGAGYGACGVVARVGRFDR